MKKDSKIIFYLTLVIIFFSDRFLKFFINNRVPENYSVKIFSYLYITNIRNKGILFGWLNKGRYEIILILFSIIAVLFIILFVHKMSRILSGFSFLSLGLIAGGILGNLFDRIRYHAVIDYINLRIWPVFNLADSCIVIGVCIYILQTWRKNGPCIL
ncbi:MAG: signal peptidase II [Candidatus Omnitrophica bacterium]|nr:signal peptidase II [Candidatus Omnitrophota bacterium]